MTQKEFLSGKVLRLEIGDITTVPAGAIVNAANSALRGGGGVDGAIHRAGGPAIPKELDTIRSAQGGCPPGSAVATGAGELPARFIFHAVGPIYGGGRQGEAETLASCYRTCLRMAEEKGIGTLTFPSISTGAYRYPVHEAARIAISEVAAHLSRPDSSLQEVTFVLFDKVTFDAYAHALREEGTIE